MKRVYFDSAATTQIRPEVINCISDVLKKEKVHIDVSRKEWAEFVVGQRSFADRHKVIAQFEEVLARQALPAKSEALDDQLDDVAEDAGYTCDGGEDH